MITWEPVEMRTGDRIDRAFVDGLRVQGETFLRKRRAGRDLFSVDGLDLPANSNEAAALAQYRATHQTARLDIVRRPP